MPSTPYYPSYLSYLFSQYEPASLLAIPSSSSSRLRATVEFRRSWRVLCASLLGMLFCCLPGSAIGVFIGPWSDAFGWSLSAIGWFTVFLGFGAAAAGPLVGRLMDRFGARRVALAYIPAMALSMAAISRIGSDIWTLYFVVLVWGCIAPGLGAYTRAVTTWFDAGRGTAVGVICIGVGLSSAIAPRLAQWLVDEYGWRAGYLLLGSIVLLAWPIAFFWLHEQRCSTGSKAVPAESGYTRQDAMKTPVFWLLGCSFLLWGLTSGGGVFLIPFLNAQGMTRSDAASCVSMLGLTTTVGLPIIGMIIDRLHAPFVATTALLISASAFVVLGLFGSEYALLAVPMVGIAGSAWMSCLDYSTARYFGLKSFGEISALIDRMACIGVMMGPLIFSFLKDMTGNYTASYIAVGALGISSAICMAVVGRYPFHFRKASVAVAASAMSEIKRKEDLNLYAAASSEGRYRRRINS